MNIKGLRKSYKNLTMLERLSLVDNAISRDDVSEIKAIVAASPRKQISQVDYLDLMDEITKLRLCNLIVRLGYIMQFDYFIIQAKIDLLKNNSDIDRKTKLSNDVKLSAFLYVRATDSWKAVNDELGLRPDFEKEMSEFLFPLNLVEQKEEIMRKIAFSEDEVKEYFKNQTGDEKIQTLEDEIKATKKALGLPIK